MSRTRKITVTFITEIPYFFRNNPFYIDGRTNPYDFLTVYELKSLGEKMKKTILAKHACPVMMADPRRSPTESTGHRHYRFGRRWPVLRHHRDRKGRQGYRA